MAMGEYVALVRCSGVAYRAKTPLAYANHACAPETKFAIIEKLIKGYLINFGRPSLNHFVRCLACFSKGSRISQG